MQKILLLVSFLSSRLQKKQGHWYDPSGSYLCALLSESYLIV